MKMDITANHNIFSISLNFIHVMKIEKQFLQLLLMLLN